MTTQPSSRVLIGRRTRDQITVIGAGIAVTPEIVLVPLGLSGPLRPRVGVVVLPDPSTGADDAVPVLRIMRTEPDTGDALGLEVARPLPAHEDPPVENIHHWLDLRLRGVVPPARPGADEPFDDAGPESLLNSVRPLFARPAKKKNNNPICKLIPRACK